MTGLSRTRYSLENTNVLVENNHTSRRRSSGIFSQSGLCVIPELSRSNLDERDCLPAPVLLNRARTGEGHPYRTTPRLSTDPAEEFRIGVETIGVSAAGTMLGAV
jgi:hypothetical protein